MLSIIDAILFVGVVVVVGLYIKTYFKKDHFTQDEIDEYIKELKDKQ